MLCTTASGCTVHGMELGNRWTLVGGAGGIYHEGWVLSPTPKFEGRHVSNSSPWNEGQVQLGFHRSFISLMSWN